MSSRVFKARTGHTKQNPQLCGLTGNPIHEGDWIMYLVCRGADARPEYQIRVCGEREVEKEYFNRRKRRKETKAVTERDYEMGGRRFRTVYDGRRKNPDTGKNEKVFLWQEMVGHDADGEPMWRTVKCWSHVVHAKAAQDLGYEVRADKAGKWLTTEAYEGDRAIGSEHTVDAEEENAMVELARAALTDEEAGRVAPSEEKAPAGWTEANTSTPETDTEAEERADAEALGLTLEQYRKLLLQEL